MNIPVTDNGKPVQPGDSYFKYKGVYHPVVWVGDTPYRPRVETLVLMNGNAVYARIKDEDRRGSSGNGECYELPGGSIDADCEPIQQAENEVNEEALIAVKNIYDTGIQYYADYPSGFIMSGGDTPLEYAGHISTVYVAEYDGIYDREKVEKKDLDPKISENGKFYPITKMVPLFRQEHINALLNSPYVSDAVKGAIRIINRKSNPTPKKNPVASDKIVGELFFVSRLGNLEYMKGSTFKNGRLHIDTEGKSVIRVFSSVEDAINGYDSVLDKLTSGTSVYVYTIKNKADRIICPTTQQSPSSKITSEMWIPAEEPVDVKRVGLICITDTGKSGKYYYGKNSLLVGTLPKFRYTWTIKDRVTNVMESNVLVKDNKIYHGSTYLIDKFVPMSLDLGNATQEPGWSTFAFADYTLALRFGLMRAIQKVKEYYKDRCKDVVCSWSSVDKKPFISSDQYKFMKPLILNFKYYVYTIDSTDLDLGIGNDENFPEITFRESGVVPESTDVIKIDEPLLKEHLLILPGDMTIEEYTSSQEKMMNRTHNRGWYAIMMTKDYNNGLASAQLQKAVRDGYLKPGDDISTYMSKSGIAFDDDSISIRSYLTESSVVMEGIKLPGKLYHGSTCKFDELRPTGIDFGNAFQEPGWSLFTWTKLNSAIGWAIFCVIKKLDIPQYGCANSQTTILPESSYNKLKENINKFSPSDRTFYVYTIKPESDFEFGLGHSSNTPNCITIRKDHIKPESITSYKLSMELVDKYCKVVPDGYKPSLKEQGINKRLLSMYMKYDYMYQPTLRKKIKKDIESGKLSVGDDLREYLTNNDIDLKEISIIDRLLSDNVNGNVLERIKNPALESAEYSSVNKYPVFSTLMHARDCHIDWEKKHGSDPYEDWSKSVMESKEGVSEAASRSSISRNDILDKIKQFHLRLSGFDYLIVQKNGKIDYTTSKYMAHRTLTPSQFEKYKGGICWDYVPYQVDYFKKHFKNVKTKSFFHVFINDKNQPTHTFMLFYLNHKVYYFECSWKSMMGIYEFSSETDALSYIISELYKDLSPDQRDYVYDEYTLEYNPLDSSLFGLSCIEYMDYMGDKINKKQGIYKYDENKSSHPVVIQRTTFHVENNKPIVSVTESLLISKGVFDVNFEDFESGKSNVVLITGLSGSGKSTLGQKIADKYKAELVELDLFEQCYMFENDEQLKEAGEVFYVYLSHHKDIWDKLKKKELHGKELSNEIEKFLKYAITWCKSDKKNKYVLEGVQIYSFLNKEKINGVPILFVGTSALKSLIRRLSRAREHSKEDFKNEISELPQCIAWYIDENKTYEKFKKSVLESAEYSSVNKYPVFIILMHTGTPLSTTIKAVTHDEFSHAAVSFNSKLDPLYSFGTKKYGHHEHGLVQHNTKDDFYRHYHATYSVFVMYVSKEQRDKMLTRLRYFIENEANIKFDIASLIACAMQIPTEFRKKFFCSRFVMEIIGQGIELSKYPSMWTPQQISELDNITMVNKGDDLYMYDYRITEKNLKKIRDGKLDDIVLESSYPKESENYYRVEHNGVGIYEAYKNNVSLAQWKKFKSSKACAWLPVPTISYESGCISYFTEDGLQYFRTFTLPEISKEIPPNMVSIEKVHVSEDTVVYRDNYQIVVREEAMESVRSELPDSEFGLPDKRKYPLHDSAHVQSAIKFFNYVSEEDEKELAKNILKKIDEYDMKGEISVTKKNRFFKYAKSSGIMEAIDIQSDTDKDCMNQLVMGLPTNVRTKVIEKLSRYNPSNIIYEDCLYVNGCIASALTVYKDSVDKSMAHMIVVENEKSKSSDMESMINDVISGISLMYEDIETLCVLSLPAHMDVPCIMDLQREKSDIVYEGYLPIPVMEAPNEDDDTATDYTEDVADDDAEGEETATDYTEDADTGEDGDTTDDAGTEEESPDDTTTEEEGDQGGDTGEDELQATDYTDGTDTGEDTPGDAEGTATDGGTPRNGNLIDNNVLKNYSVLRNFEKLYNLTKEVSDSLDSVVMPSKLQNTVLAQVLKNLNSIKEFVLSYVKFQFSSDNYAQNLYYYNLVLQTLNLNLELLKSNKELEDTKLSKKNSRR